MVSSSFVYAACFALPPILALAPSPGSRTWAPICIYQPWPQFVFTGPGPWFVFTSPSPKFEITDSSLQFYYQSGAWVLHIRTLCLYLRPWLTICITGLRPEFASILLLVVVVAMVVVMVAVVLISLE